MTEKYYLDRLDDYVNVEFTYLPGFDGTQFEQGEPDDIEDIAATLGWIDITLTDEEYFAIRKLLLDKYSKPRYI